MSFWIYVVVVVLFVIAIPLFVCRLIDYPICFVTQSGIVLYANKSFKLQCCDIAFGHNLFSVIKWYPSGYIEIPSNKNGFILVRDLWLVSFVFITPSPPIPYIYIDRVGKVLKSRWPFISNGDNFFSHVQISPDQLMKNQNILVTEMDGVRVVLSFVWQSEYITVLDLSAMIRPETMKMAMLGKETLKITHDLSNSLTGIIGFCDLLSFSSKNMAEVKGIKNNAEHAVALMKQLLSWAQPKHEELRYISPYKSLMQMQLFLRCIRGNKSKVRINGSTKACTAISPSSFEQIITNLVTNARDAGCDDISISVTEENYDEFEWKRGIAHAGSYIIITVHDTGPGILAENEHKLFDTQHSTKEDGTGQGLSIVADLLHEVHGFIVHIPDACGAKFQVGLPIVKPPKVKKCECVQSIVGQLRILIVEDNESVRVLIHKALKSAGHKVFSAKDLGEAKQKLEKDKFDVVVTDSELPDGNGLELVKLVSCRVIVASGYSKDVLKSKTDQDFEFLAKPFTLRELIEMIGQVCVEKK